MNGDHLRQEARVLLDLPLQQRIYEPWPKLFVALDQVRAVHDVLENLYNMADQERQYSVLVWGESGTGKSTALQRFVDRKMAQVGENGPILPSRYAHIPTFRITTPVQNESDFYLRILEQLGRQDSLHRSPGELAHATVRLMKLNQVRLPIFDEIHNVVPEEPSQGRVFATVLKDISNTIQRPIVFAGTERALKFFKADAELSTRYFDHEVGRFKKPDHTFAEFLYNFEKLIPLREESGLSDDPLCKHLHRLSGGLIGPLTELLQWAAIAAVQSGAERITKAIIDGTPVARSLAKRLPVGQQLAKPKYM